MSLEYKAPKLRPSIAMDQLKNRKLGSVKRERRSERPHRARLKMPGSQDGGAWSAERGAWSVLVLFLDCRSQFRAAAATLSCTNVEAARKLVPTR